MGPPDDPRLPEGSRGKSHQGTENTKMSSRISFVSFLAALTSSRLGSGLPLDEPG